MPFITSASFQVRSFLMAARHHPTPGTNVTHPKGVIVPGDAFMTAKLRDTSYVPYCVKRTSCGRVRRTEFGFECPSCGNRMNYDLTHYNGNVDVQYESDASGQRSEVTQ